MQATVTWKVGLCHVVLWTCMRAMTSSLRNFQWLAFKASWSVSMAITPKGRADSSVA